MKQWNGEKGGMWCIPRRGSPEHAEVLKIMNSDKKKVATIQKKERKDDLAGQMRLKRLSKLLPIYNEKTKWSKISTKKRQEFCEDLFVLLHPDKMQNYSQDIKDDIAKLHMEEHLVKYFTKHCAKFNK